MKRTQLLDKNQVAEMLSVSVRTVENWTQQRKIPFVKLAHRCVRYRLDEIEQMITDRTVTPR